jgi:hypothetical protein
MYNASIHSTTEFSPNSVHFGRALSSPLDMFDPNVKSLVLDKSFSLNSVLKEMQNIYNQVHINLKTKQQEQNVSKNQNAKSRTFNPGDIVYLRSKDKYRPSYSGPYKVVCMTSSVNVTIMFAENPHATSFKVHCDRLVLSTPRFSHLTNAVYSI